MKPSLANVMGIDYGAKLAGTTAAAMLIQDRLHVWQSQRGQDADSWLFNLAAELKPALVFMDAPLSLPSVYTLKEAPAGADYFYRSCDRELRAMSPMFLGGLTARAMQLRARLAATGITVLETYPPQAMRLLLPGQDKYKQRVVPPAVFMEALQLLTGYVPVAPLQNWHQADAILAWHSGCRYLNGQAAVYGDATEGQIIV